MRQMAFDLQGPCNSLEKGLIYVKKLRLDCNFIVVAFQ